MHNRINWYYRSWGSRRNSRSRSSRSRLHFFMNFLLTVFWSFFLSLALFVLLVISLLFFLNLICNELIYVNSLGPV